eukprot:TRINITY_DN8927_c0_g1_i1.p1 TRINITY_DN8927_c0_g1~~TRINITY_DN8927_c0_g1_i1.p1  ORF type:complete len:723 (+),score=172.34 TRINITY_DN8927_c0_g1_i1:49-2217(+)
MHVSCRNRGIVELDLQSVFANDQERGALAVVKSLDLSHNELSHLGGLQPFSSLIALDLSYNRLVSLSGLPLGLVRLNVSHNQLTNIEGLATLPLLQDLDVSNNKLTSVHGIQRSSPLTSLKLGNNRLSSARGIENLQHLQTLELHNNFINRVEDLEALCSNRRLKNLTISNNPLTQVATFRSTVTRMLGSLLTLDGCTVQRLDGDMSNHSFNTATTPSRRASATSDISSVHGHTKPLASAISIGSTVPGRVHRSNSPASNVNRSRSSTPVRYSSAVHRTHTPPAQHPGTAEGASASRTPTMKPSTPRGHTPVRAHPNPNPATPHADQSISNNTQTPGHAFNTSLAFESVKQRADSRRQELNSSKKQLEMNVGELQTLLEQEYQLTSSLQKQKKKLEQELAETKKMLSEELQKIEGLNDENGMLKAKCDELQSLNVKCLKIHKHSELKLKEERARRIGEFDKLKSTHNAVVEGLRNKVADGAAAAKQNEESYTLWLQEKAKLHEYIQILEKENSSLAVKLSKYENAAADAQHLAANEFSGMSLSPVKKAPATPRQHLSSMHEEPIHEQVSMSAASVQRMSEVKEDTVPPGTIPPGMSDARKLIEMSRNMNAKGTSRPSSVASGATTPKARGQSDIQWAGPPSDVGSALSEKGSNQVEFAIHLKKWIMSELDKKSTPVPARHPPNTSHNIIGERQAPADAPAPSVEDLWTRGNTILNNHRESQK